MGDIYRCNAISDPKFISQDSTEISSINGTHEGSKANDDVIGFRIHHQIVHYFPKNLELFFKNLKAILISSCNLKEIHQSDLKSLINLVYFYLTSNSIEVIEEGLFDYNPNLETVGFYESKIIHIDPNVFDHLNKLSTFWFRVVPCIKKSVSDSREKVLETIKLVKNQCVNSEVLSLTEIIKNLKNESKISNLEAFNAKFEILEKSLNNSKFSKFRPLKNNFEDLK